MASTPAPASSARTTSLPERSRIGSTRTARSRHCPRSTSATISAAPCRAGRRSWNPAPRCRIPTTTSNTRRGAPAGQCSAVELFAARQHRDELFRARNPRLRLLRGLHPPAEGVAVGAVERVEEGFRLAVARQRRRQLAGNLNSCGTLVGGVRANVGIRLLDFAPPCPLLSARRHPAPRRA